MALSLAKNQTISLEKTTGNGLTKIRMGLGSRPEAETLGRLFQPATRRRGRQR